MVFYLFILNQALVQEFLLNKCPMSSTVVGDWNWKYKGKLRPCLCVQQLLTYPGGMREKQPATVEKDQCYHGGGLETQKYSTQSRLG